MALQVTCITKRGNHYSPHERISHIGNAAEGWRITEDEAIRNINYNMQSYYTLVNGRRADIVVAQHSGRNYLRTTADGYSPDNLLALREC